MSILHIHTYLVHPGKHSEDAPKIGGAAVQLQGKLFDLLSEIYIRSDSECDIDISFNAAADGSQANPCRDLVISYLQSPSVRSGRKIAERLEEVTTHRSGLGLLFLISGRESREHKIVISRFPADSAILAEEDQQSLTVEFLERVFMKSATAYKAAVYHDSSLISGFWTGRAIDKQINSAAQLSNYWIADFLDSDFRTTAAAGTRRLALALRDAARHAAGVNVKTEIAAAVTLASKLGRKSISIRQFGDQFSLSDEAKQAIANEVKTSGLLDEHFQFDSAEFTTQVAYRSVELDSGGILTAQAAEFDNAFNREVLDESERRVRFRAEGTIVSEKVGKGR